MSDMTDRQKAQARLTNHKAELTATKEQVAGARSAVADAIGAVLPILEEQAGVMQDILDLVPAED